MFDAPRHFLEKLGACYDRLPGNSSAAQKKWFYHELQSLMGGWILNVLSRDFKRLVLGGTKKGTEQFVERETRKYFRGLVHILNNYPFR